MMDKLMKDIVTGAQQIPGAGGCPGMVKAIIDAFGILEQRIEQLSIKVMIEKENAVLMNERVEFLKDRIKVLEEASCCKDESGTTTEDLKTDEELVVEKPSPLGPPASEKANPRTTKKAKGDA